MKPTHILTIIALFLELSTSGQAVSPEELHQRERQHERLRTSLICTSGLPPQMISMLSYNAPNQSIPAVMVLPGFGVMHAEDPREGLYRELANSSNFPAEERLTIIRALYKLHTCPCVEEGFKIVYASLFDTYFSNLPQGLEQATQLLKTPLTKKEAAHAALTCALKLTEFNERGTEASLRANEATREALHAEVRKCLTFGEQS